MESDFKDQVMHAQRLLIDAFEGIFESFTASIYLKRPDEVIFSLYKKEDNRGYKEVYMYIRCNLTIKPYPFSVSISSRKHPLGEDRRYETIEDLIEDLLPLMKGLILVGY